MFMTTWSYVTKVDGKQLGDAVNFKLFDSVTDYGKLIGDKFAPFWFTLFQILVVVMVVIAVAMLAVYVLNDLKVLKVQKLEKLLSVLLVLVGVVSLVVVLITTLTNKASIDITKTVYGFNGALMAWLAPSVAVVGGMLACYGASGKAKSKKKKK